MRKTFTAATLAAALLAAPAHAASINGSAGNDSLRPTAEMDYINGGAGIDTLLIDQKLAEVKLNQNPDGSWRIYYPATGATDQAVSIERIVFADYEVSLRGLSTAAPAPVIPQRVRDLVAQLADAVK